VFTLTALVLAIPAWLRRFATEVAVTDRRVIYKTGLIQRHTIEINIDKVESADVDQSILGRLFGFGSITIRGTGEGIEPLRNIAQPLESVPCWSGDHKRPLLIPPEPGSGDHLRTRSRLGEPPPHLTRCDYNQSDSGQDGCGKKSEAKPFIASLIDGRIPDSPNPGIQEDARQHPN